MVHFLYTIESGTKTNVRFVVVVVVVVWVFLFLFLFALFVCLLFFFLFCFFFGGGGGVHDKRTALVNHRYVPFSFRGSASFYVPETH